MLIRQGPLTQVPGTYKGQGLSRGTGESLGLYTHVGEEVEGQERILKTGP